MNDAETRAAVGGARKALKYHARCCLVVAKQSGRTHAVFQMRSQVWLGLRDVMTVAIVRLFCV